MLPPESDIIAMEAMAAAKGKGEGPEAGVGMTIRERHPFFIEDLRPDGPAAKTAVIKIGDELTKVDGCSLHANLTGEQVLMRQNLSALLGRAARPRLCCWALPCDFHLCADTCVLHISSAAPPCARFLLTTHVPYHQVRTLVIGPVGSVVELQFREVPKRTERGAYRVRLMRQAAELGGTTQMSRGCSHPVALHHTEPPLPPPSLWPWRGKICRRCWAVLLGPALRFPPLCGHVSPPRLLHACRPMRPIPSNVLSLVCQRCHGAACWDAAAPCLTSWRAGLRRRL